MPWAVLSARPRTMRWVLAAYRPVSVTCVHTWLSASGVVTDGSTPAKGTAGRL